MNSFLRNTVLLLCVLLLPAGVCLAKEVHLKDGSIIDSESVWRRGDKVVVKINRDTMLEFRQDEVDLGRTFPKAAAKPRQVKKKKASAAVRHRRAVKPAAASVAAPSQAAPKAAAPQSAAKPLPTAKPAPSAPQPPAAAPAPSPAPGPGARETVRPKPAQTGSAVPASPPDQASQQQKNRQAAEMMAEAIQKKDPELLKKAIAARQGAMQPGGMPSAGVSPMILLLVLGLGLLMLVSLWVVFVKAGEAGWKSIIPIYNMYVLLLISGKPGWWLLLLFIPLVGSIFHLLAMLSLAERFGRGALFGIGLFFLPMFFFPLLAFGGTQYEG